jgi:hypothetical protein
MRAWAARPQSAFEKGANAMNWKENKAVGAVAAVLVVIAVVAIVFFARSQMVSGPTIYFICESTEEVFPVMATPGDEEYEEFYIVTAGSATKCKVCGKDDAYLAMETQGKWAKMPPPSSGPAEDEPEVPMDARNQPAQPPAKEPPADWDAVQESKREAERPAGGTEGQ